MPRPADSPTPLTLSGPASKVRRSKSSARTTDRSPGGPPSARCEAKRFSIHGAVAQLGERRVRNAKVGGSIPLGSTMSDSAAYALGVRRRSRFGASASGHRGRAIPRRSWSTPSPECPRAHVDVRKPIALRYVT